MSLFGYATVLASAQSPVQGTQSCFLEYSACLVEASYFAQGSTLAVPVPLTPSALSYRVDDICSGANIVPWTAINAPAPTSQITVSSTQNAMISLTACSETHQVLLKITDGGPNVSYARCLFDLLRVPGVP